MCPTHPSQLHRPGVLIAALLVAVLTVGSFSAISGPFSAAGASAPRDSGERRLTLWSPEQLGEKSYKLRGKVSWSPRWVKLQRKATKRWKTVKRVRVRAGRYQTSVQARGRAKKYRVVADGTRSRLRRIPAKQQPATTAGPRDACGVRPQKSPSAYWSCTFVDDFNQDSLDLTKWTRQTVFTTGTLLAHACYADDPANAAVSGGALRLTLRRVQLPVLCNFSGSLLGTRFTSGMVSTYRTFSQRYGRFEARMKVTDADVPGLHEAFWLWPDDRAVTGLSWPAAGEIDIAETYSTFPDLAIPFLHYGEADNGGPVPGLNTAWDCRADRGVYNTYTLEWSPNRIEILVNGVTCLVNSGQGSAFGQAFNTAPYIIAFTQAIGDAANEYQADTPIPATTSVDYVRVWD